MGQFFESVPAWLIPWIEAQKMFWVATAPLAEDGHVNVSPKGSYDKTLHIVLDEPEVEGKPPGSRAVWYEDLTGSGVETISHIRENGRMTLMLTAFEGPPRIVRLFGTGKVHEFGTPEYNELLPPEKRHPGSRAIIWLDIHKVGTSCGYSIPFFAYKAPRVKLLKMAMGMEQADYNNSCSSSSASDDPDPPVGTNGQAMTEAQYAAQLLKRGMQHYWKNSNIKSLDGLPGLLYAFNSSPGTDWKDTTKGGHIQALQDDERQAQQSKPGNRESRPAIANLTFGFGVGVVVGMVLIKWKGGL